MVVGRIYHYNQHQLSVDQQIDLLKSKGLTFIDESKAKLVLNHVSMFRMKNYFRPLQMSNSRHFKPGVTFEQAYSLYEFDSELRRLICSELEKIEISIRTQLSYIVTDFTKDPFWFTQPSNFRQKNFVQSTLPKLKVELDRNDDDQIVDFRRRYKDPFPPSWVALEASSFGTLSKLYQNLSSINCRKTVANYYGIAGTVMESWLHAMANVRNICAHHNRLWNRNLHICCTIPQQSKLPFLTTSAPNNRIYFVMSIILYFLKTINAQNDFADRVKKLLSKYQNIDIQAMGFPSSWEKEPLWQ